MLAEKGELAVRQPGRASPVKREAKDRLWEQLYREYHQKVKECAFHILKNNAEAEDVAQDTFLRLRGHIDQVAHGDRQKTHRYVICIARNLSFNRLHKGERETCLPQADVEAIAGSTRSPEEALIAAEDRQRIRCSVRKLNKDSQDVLILRYVMEYPEKKIADRLGISANLVAVRLLRARQSLRASQLNAKQG